jgi:hypothetical protein
MLPAYLVDTLLKLMGRPPFLVDVYKRTVSSIKVQYIKELKVLAANTDMRSRVAEWDLFCTTVWHFCLPYIFQSLPRVVLIKFCVWNLILSTSLNYIKKGIFLRLYCKTKKLSNFSLKSEKRSYGTIGMHILFNAYGTV